MVEETKKLVNNRLYFWEGIACIFVVLIHCQLPGRVGIVTETIARFAVPLFFSISGYYWAKVEINQRTYKARCKIKKNLKLFIAITAVYILYRIMVQCALHLEAVNVINARSFIKLLLFNETDFICTVLWYLLALIYIYILLIFLKSSKSYYVVAFLSFGVFLLSYMLKIVAYSGNLSEKLNENSAIYRNWLTVGIPFFMFGYLFSTKLENKLKEVFSYKMTYMLLIISMFGCILERYIIGNSMDVYLFSIIIVFTIMLMCSIKPNIKQNYVVEIGKNISLAMYLFHPLVMYGYRYLFGYFNLMNSKITQWTLPIIVILTIIVIYEVIHRINIIPNISNVNNLSRTTNAKRNVVSGIAQMLITNILQFVNRKIFIVVLGASYLGLSGLFTNVLSVLSLAELGVGSAIVFSLYKPLAENDEEKIHALMELYKRVYRIIGCIVLAIGIAITPILKFIVNLEQGVDINYYYIYYLFLMNSVISYWFYAYRNSIIGASQKDYLLVKINVSFPIIQTIMQIFALVLLKGNTSYYVYLTIPIIMLIIKNYIVYKVSSRLYPYLDNKCKSKLEKSELTKIKKNVYALSVTKLSSTIYYASDNIVISTFIGTIFVGLYSNYSMITVAVTGIINIIFNSLRNSVGDLNASSDKEHVYVVYKRILFANFWIYGFCAIAFMVLFNPFIVLFFGKNYAFDTVVTIVIVFTFLIPGLNHTNTIYKDACGLFWQTRYRTLATALVNITFSVILAIVIPVEKYKIMGVLLATIISYVVTILPVDPKIIYRDVFGMKRNYFIKWFINNLLIISVIMAITYGICLFIPRYTWIGFIIQCVIVVIVPNALFAIIKYKTSEFKYYKELIAETILKIINK